MTHAGTDSIHSADWLSENLPTADPAIYDFNNNGRVDRGDVQALAVASDEGQPLPTTGTSPGGGADPEDVIAPPLALIAVLAIIIIGVMQ